MSTRGTIEVNGKFYVIGHDAYTSYALPRLKLAAKLGSLSKFLSKVHEMLDVYEKPTPKYSKFLGSFGDEHRYLVSLASGTVQEIPWLKYRKERMANEKGWRVIQRKAGNGKWVTTEKIYEL